MPTSFLSRSVFVIALALIVAAAVFLGMNYLNKSSSNNARSLIGGPFSLVTHTGKAVTEKDFEGKYMLIYFGYTFCPDVCPTSLTLLSDAMDIVEAKDPELAGLVVPVFITVDPERDTVSALKDYVGHFYPTMVGLTGSLEQVSAAAKSYKVFYQKAEAEESSDYLMDHSSITYLMGPDGVYVKHYSHGTNGEVMAASLLEILKK
ncbi:SCO family protein [Kiloniella laminariae]|uniref:SCO family protein n=1 Tax=Kiloniella laminariae TaxID=454162 RepID=A0ABT4LIN8_9PROT|nr:SCO family protein [Kiloniella laminariae]MCZ4280970.1 SCO family protein [Kiloniella laminariae]